jgi:hypothetical protein
LLSSRLDLAGTSIVGFRNILSAYSSSPSWYTLFPGGGLVAPLRFQAQPFFLTKPPTPESLAYQAPILIRGCTQFTVEYAGDYLNQTTATNATTAANQGITDTYDHYNSTTTTYSAGSTDGQIDYIIVGTYPNFLRKIRWYGFPRGTTNNTTLNVSNGDVTPLRDVLAIAANPANQGMLAPGVTSAMIPPAAPFEQMLPELHNNTAAVSSDYAAQTANAPGPTSMLNGAKYICAWGPSDRKPQMIRITMTIDDPGGRLGDGQTYEYIYTLP